MASKQIKFRTVALAEPTHKKLVAYATDKGLLVRKVVELAVEAYLAATAKRIENENPS